MRQNNKPAQEITMNGSEKQIELAEEIKDMFLNGKELSAYHGYKGLKVVLAGKKEYSAKREAKGRDASTVNQDIEKIAELVSRIESEESAEWFIENSKNPRIIKYLGDA